MKRKLLSILALLCLSVSSAWADWDGGNYTATAGEEISGPVNVSTATLTINSGITVTVRGGIEITGTLTVTGGGTLIVHGSTGSDGIGGNGDNGGSGGDAIKGNVTIIGATVRAYGGDGGYGGLGIGGSPGENGSEGGHGGHGGNAFANGTVTIYSGSVYATGGKGGAGGEGGEGGYGWTDDPIYDDDGSLMGEPIEHAAGAGGRGGNGGDGGNAFNGTVIFYGGYVEATGGYGGLGGYGGRGGEGCDGGQGDYGSDGDNLENFAADAFSGDNVTFETTNYDMKCYGYNGIDYDKNENTTVHGNAKVEISAPDACILTSARLANDAYWTTFYSDSYNFIAPEGTQVFTVSLDNTTITLNEIADRIVAAGQGVVLKQATTASETTATITMVMTDEDPAGYFANNALIGTASSITNPGNAYVLNSGSKGVGFYKLKSTGTIGENKAFLTYDGGSGSARGFFLFNEATSISEELRVKSEEFASAVVFDLQGRRVSQPAKGLYIVNGKKVVIK